MFWTSLLNATIFYSKEELQHVDQIGLFCIRGGYFQGVDICYWTNYVILPTLVGLYLCCVLYALHVHKVIYFNTAAFVSLFYETENEPSSKTDIKMLIDQLTYSTAISITAFVCLFTFPETFGSASVLNATMMLVYILAIPTVVSLIFGTYVMNYLKGDTSSNSVLYAGIFDLATFFGFFKRFLIQFIRYILISVKVVFFNVFVDRTIIRGRYLMQVDRTKSWDWDPLYWEFCSCVHELGADIIHAVWELTNIFIIYYAQLGAFVIVLCWLLKALYATAWPIIKHIWYKNKRGG